MAKEKTDEIVEKTDDLVDFYAFKDNGDYKDDIFVAVNGKRYQIKRGVNVKVPANVAQVLYHSMAQNNEAADFIDNETSKYARAAALI